MSKPKFDPNQPFEAVAESKPKFDPNAPFEVAQDSGEQEQSFGDKVLGGVVQVGRTIDSYTGAPTRAAIGRMQDGGGISESAQAFSNQFGEHPEFAPTGKQIAQKAGVTDQTFRDLAPGVSDGMVDSALGAINPGFSIASKYLKPQDVPISTMAGMGVDVAVDWTNALPLVPATKAAIQGTEIGAKAFARAGQAADKVGNLAAKGAKETGKRAVSVLFGPDMNSINRYLDRADQIRNAKSVEEIKNSIDSTMQGLFDAVQNSEMSEDQAKEAVKLVQSQIRDATQDANFKFRVDKADVNDALNKFDSRIAEETRNANYQYRVDKADASSALKESTSKADEAYRAEVARLRSVNAPIQMGDDVSAAIQEAKQRVVRGSEDSYKILEQDPGAYSVRGAAPILRAMADEMNIVGFVPKGVEGTSQLGNVAKKSAPVTTQSRGVQQELLRFAKMLEETPELVPARELKKIIQQIDKSEMAMYGQPGFDGRVSEAYKMARATIDKAIKAKNPAYAAKMEQVAGDMDLMTKSIDRFGDQRAAASRLNSIGSNTAQADRDLLKILGEASGKDFSGPISEFMTNQRTLGNPEAMRLIEAQARAQSGVDKNAARLADLSRPEAPIKYAEDALNAKGLANNPEYSALKQKSAEMSRPEYSKQFVEGELNAKGLPQKLSQSEKAFQESRQGLEAAKEKLSPFKTITPVNSENIIRGLMGVPGKKIEMRRTIEELSKVSEKDFVNMIDDARAAQQFDGEFKIGSRNVNLFTILGFFTGGPFGGATGAALGAITDKFGPKMAQYILDGALKIKGAPTAAKIKALKLQPTAEMFLIKELGKGLSGPELWVAQGQDQLLEVDSSLDREFLEKYQKSKEGRSELMRAGEPSMSPEKRRQLSEKIKSSKDYQDFQKQKTKSAQGKEPDQSSVKPQMKFPQVLQKDGFTAVVRNMNELEEARSEGWA